jgi:hypothetical protein
VFGGIKHEFDFAHTKQKRDTKKKLNKFSHEQLLPKFNFDYYSGFSDTVEKEREKSGVIYHVNAP